VVSPPETSPIICLDLDLSIPGQTLLLATTTYPFPSSFAIGRDDKRISVHVILPVRLYASIQSALPSSSFCHTSKDLNMS
jgi:hypothetical protein